MSPMTELLEKIKYYQDMFDGVDTTKQKPKIKPKTKPKPFVKEVSPVNIDISLPKFFEPEPRLHVVQLKKANGLPGILELDDE